MLGFPWHHQAIVTLRLQNVIYSLRVNLQLQSLSRSHRPEVLPTCKWSCSSNPNPRRYEATWIVARTIIYLLLGNSRLWGYVSGKYNPCQDDKRTRIVRISKETNWSRAHSTPTCTCSNNHFEQDSRAHRYTSFRDLIGTYKMQQYVPSQREPNRRWNWKPRRDEWTLNKLLIWFPTSTEASLLTKTRNRTWHV